MVGPVDFRYERLQHGWAGRNFGDFDAGAIGLGEFHQFWPDAPCNFMALCAPRVAREQVHLDVGLIRLLAQKVMPNKPIEVVWAGYAGVDLVIDDLVLLSKIPSQALGNAGCLLQR